jgi:hypothetical protein
VDLERSGLPLVPFLPRISALLEAEPGSDSQEQTSVTRRERKMPAQEQGWISVAWSEYESPAEDDRS